MSQRRKLTLLVDWIVLALVLGAGGLSAQSTNKLYEEGRVGQDIVARAIRAVQENFLFPFSNDFQFLRRVALVETNFGATLTSHWGEPIGLDGIWQITPQMLQRAKQFSAGQTIASTYQLSSVSHASETHNLKVPYWAAVAAHFYLLSCLAGRPVPASISEQAALWSRCWRANAQPAQQFERDVRNMSLPCASAGADVLFVVDSSGSIGSDQYRYARSFISNALDELDISESAFQVAIDIYSDDVERSLDFRQGRSKATAKRVADSLRYLDSGTDTTAALQVAREYSFRRSNGARDTQSAFARIAVLITDGYPNDGVSSVHEATLLKQAGVKLFAVGVGERISAQYLHSVASAPTCTHVFQISNYTELARAFPTELQMRLCEEVPGLQPSGTCPDAHCTASGSLAFGRQKTLSTCRVPGSGTRVRVCARGILHAFFSSSERSPGPASFEQFVAIENLDATTRVCKHLRLQPADGARVHFTVIGKDSQAPVAFDTECFTDSGASGDDRGVYVDRKVVPVGSYERATLVKDQELVLRLANVSAGPAELELCAEQGDALLYFSQTNTQPSEANNQLKLDTRVAADQQRCVRAAVVANASCDAQSLYASVIGASRMNQFRLLLSQKPPEAILLNIEKPSANASTRADVSRLYCKQSAELLANDSSRASSYANADYKYEVEICTTRGAIQLVVREALVEPVASTSTVAKHCSRYNLSGELVVRQNSPTPAGLVPLAAKLRGVEPINEFTLRGKRAVGDKDERLEFAAVAAAGASEPLKEGGALKAMKLLPLAGVVAGALVVVAAVAGGGLLAKRLVTNALNKGQYHVDKKERKKGIDRERDLRELGFSEHTRGDNNYVRFAGGEANVLTGE